MTRFLFDSQASRLIRLALAWIVLFWAIASAMGNAVFLAPDTQIPPQSAREVR